MTDHVKESDNFCTDEIFKFSLRLNKLPMKGVHYVCLFQHYIFTDIFSLAILIYV